MIQQLFKGRFSLLTMVFVALLALAGCQSKPQGLTPEQIALLQSQGFKLTDNGWEFGLSDKVLFGNNIGKLNPESTETVQKMGRALLSVGITKFRLDGHTDNYGEDSYNDQLSLRRADAVADLLASVGIPRANIETRGMGKRDPVADNRTLQRPRGKPPRRDRRHAISHQYAPLSAHKRLYLAIAERCLGSEIETGYTHAARHPINTDIERLRATWLNTSIPCTASARSYRRSVIF